MPSLKENKFFAHSSSFVNSKKIGRKTKIWAFCNILKGAQIGEDCNINDHVFIENDVVVGNRVTIKCGVQLWDGLRVEDDVFIGPNATFTNDNFPRSKKYPKKFLKTVIGKGASIGANATILPGLKIGANAMIGAGAVVTKDVPRNAIVVGNPARITGYVDAYDISPKTVITLDSAYEKEPQIKVKGVKLYKLPKYNDIRGDLSVAEFQKEIPFLVKRVFMVYNVPSEEIRGEHAHKKQHQYLICLKGSLNVVVDDGVSTSEIKMLPLAFGLHIAPNVWSIQYKFSTDAVLLVFASDKYDPSEYIRIYDEFLKYIK